MARTIRHLLTAFIAGEISPLLFGRVDSQQYQLGLQTCENFVPVNEGPLVKRPGWEYIRPAASSAVWLTPFRFSVTQEYVIEWGHLTARFFTNGGRVETSPGVAYAITTPYTAAHVPAISTQQSFDRLYIDHPVYAPGFLTRTSATTFTHSASAIINGPFADANTDEAITVTADDVIGSVTVTAGAAIFRSGHVGSLFRIEAKDFSNVTQWDVNTKGVTIGDLRRSEGKVYQAASAGVTGSVPPTHTSGTEWDGSAELFHNNDGPFGVQWTYLHDRFGIVQIATVAGGGLSCTATVVRRLPTSITTVGSYRWAYCVWSNDAGWPGIVVHAFGRQVHFKDFELCASVVGDFLNHQAFTSLGTVTADMAFRRRLATENPPLWALEDRKIIIGTASKELAIGALNTQAAVAADNIDSSPQSFYGSEAVDPVQLGSETVFVERGGRRLRSAAYDFGSDRYQAADLTAAARHITAPGMVQLAVQRWPFSMLHVVRNDGQMVVHPINRGEVKGFARTVAGGGAQVLSAVAIMDDDGKRDDLWALITRSTPAGIVKEIWKQSTWRELGDNIAEAFFVDAGVRVAASGGQATFTGLTHLAGQAVAVLAGGGVITGQSVASDGTLTLPPEQVPPAAYTLIVGLAYEARVVTLRPFVQGGAGGFQGFLQRVAQAFLRVIETVGIKAGATHGGVPLEDQIDRPANAAMDAQIPAFTGDVKVLVSSEPDREATMTLVSDAPLPATIAMISFKIESGDA